MKNNISLKIYTEEEIIIGMMEDAIDELEKTIQRMEASGMDMTTSKDLLEARKITLKKFQERG